MTDPNLESHDEEQNQGEPSPQHIEVAPPADLDDVAPPAAPAAGPPPVRSFPQHYKLLFASVVVFASTLTVWERAHVFGADVHGSQMISGMLLMALSGYGVIVSVMNIMQGRLAGMLAMFLTGVFAVYFGGPKLFATHGAEGCLGADEIEAYMKTKGTPLEKIPQRFLENDNLEFPRQALEPFDTAQDIYTYYVGQFAPGPILATLGGLMLLWVFLSAMFGGKKKSAEPAPAPSSGRRRRR
ncbi:MAG: hypothetical protein AAGD14_08710 [Planctomycetota bacterium]